MVKLPETITKAIEETCSGKHAAGMIDVENFMEYIFNYI